MADLGAINLTRVESLEDVTRMMQWLGERRQFLGVDVETSGLLAPHDYIRLCQFGDGKEAYALDWRDWRGVCREVLSKYNRPMVAHNALFEAKMFEADGTAFPQRYVHDSMVMAHLHDSTRSVALKPSCVRYVDRRAAVGQDLLKEAFARGGWDWATIPTDVPAYWVYAALDTSLTALLAEQLWPKVESDWHRAYETEMAVIYCLRDAELTGLLVDEGYRQLACMKLEQELDSLARQIPVSNPLADQQIIDLLHRLDARWEIYTEKGNLSVDKVVLKWLASQGFEVADTIQAYRTKYRQLNNYLYKFDDVAHGGFVVGDSLHASTRPLGARTGRQSVVDPPLQQLPRGRVVRDAIIARPGTCFVLADFAGMEMRALASKAREQKMLEAYSRGEDLHDFVARTLYGENFTKPQRTLCKNAGFAKIYGAGLEKFAATAQISKEQAGAFLQQYDEMFPGVQTFMNDVVSAVYDRAGGRKGNGWITLTNGRRLLVEADTAYKAVNYLIQGSCAITTKEKIIELSSAGLGDYFRLAVHDELIFEVPLEHAREARQVIERVMPDRHNFPGVTLEIESDIVYRWGAHYAADGYPKFIETEDWSFE